jgi:hypothetical protein
VINGFNIFDNKEIKDISETGRKKLLEKLAQTPGVPTL